MDDTVKLYVIVMTILLCVMGVVAWSTWQRADAYDRAIATAKQDAAKIRDYGADVTQLCRQLETSKFKGKNPTSLVEEMVNLNRFTGFEIKPDRPQPVRGTNAKEVRIKVAISRQMPLQRHQVAKLCRDVELASNGILKTLELNLRRWTGSGAEGAGKRDAPIADDTYVGDIFFGYRFVE